MDIINMEKFEKIERKFFNISEKLDKACVEYLKEKLKENNGKITWDEEFDFPLTVVFNGGDEQKTPTNAFSTVRGVYMENEKIYLDTEDSSEYGIWNLGTFDLYSVCNFIRVNVLEDTDESDEEGYYDINGNKVCVGDRVIWHDPDKSAIDLDRVYIVHSFNGDIVNIADDISTAEVFASELEVVEH